MLKHSLIASAFTIALFAGYAQAQSTLGTITGLITDSSGAVIPSAVVVATNTATGAKAQTISSSTGNYVVPNLPVGPYEVSVAISGFKAWTRSGINVSSNDNLRIDVTLEVGSASESVTVSAEASLLKTDAIAQTVLFHDLFEQAPSSRPSNNSTRALTATRCY